MKFSKKLSVLIVSASALALGACGGSGSSDTTVRTKNAALDRPELQLSKPAGSPEIADLPGNIRGIATDGQRLFVRSSINTAGEILETDFNGQNTVKHTTVHYLVNTPLTDVDNSRTNMAYSHGCIWMLSITGRIYCVDVTTWIAYQRKPPLGHIFPAGQESVSRNLTDFPDGRIGVISKPQNVSGVWQSVLSVYNVTGAGNSVALTWDRDYVLTDTQANWPADDHGIATDGRFLYRLQYNGGYKVWDLSAGSTVPVYFNGDGEGECGPSGSMCSINPKGINNATYIAHDHVSGRFLIGDFDSHSFYYTVLPDGSAPTTTTKVAEEVASEQVVSTTVAPEDSAVTEDTVVGNAVASESTSEPDTTVANDDQATASSGSDTTVLANDSNSEKSMDATEGAGTGTDSENSSNVWWVLLALIVVLGGGGFIVSRTNNENE